MVARSEVFLEMVYVLRGTCLCLVDVVIGHLGHIRSRDKALYAILDMAANADLLEGRAILAARPIKP
jgi:hypothetical protein